MWYIRSCKRESIHASVYTLDRKHMHDEKESVDFMLSKHVYQTRCNANAFRVIVLAMPLVTKTVSYAALFFTV